MNNQKTLDSMKLGQGHNFQNYMKPVWLIGIGAAFIMGIVLPVGFLDWFYGKNFWSEYGLLKMMIKAGNWRYFNYLNIDRSGVMLGLYFLIENIIICEIVFMWAAYKIVKAEEKRHIKIEVQYREKLNSGTKDKNFIEKEKDDGEEKQNNKFKTE